MQPVSAPKCDRIGGASDQAVPGVEGSARERFAPDAQWSADEVRIARQLREQTTLSLEQIAIRLHIGAASHAAPLLYHRKDEK